MSNVIDKPHDQVLSDLRVELASLQAALRVQIVVERVNSHIELSVSDTGKGIAAEFLPHVFERFSQAENSSRRGYTGLGIWTATC